MHATVNESPSLPRCAQTLLAANLIEHGIYRHGGDHTKRLAASPEAALGRGRSIVGAASGRSKIFSILFNQARCLAFDTKNAGFLLSAKNSLVTSQNSALLTPQTTGALLTHSAVLRAFALAFLCCLLPACENGIVLDFKLFIKQSSNNVTQQSFHLDTLLR